MPRRDHRAIALKGARSRARRRQALGIAPVCSECAGPLDTSGAYCRKCRRRYMQEYRARPGKKHRRSKALPGVVESVSRKLSRETLQLEEVTMAEPDDLMPQAGLAQAADPSPAEEREAAPNEPAAKPVPAKPVLVPAAARKAQPDLAATAGQLMIDRVRRLMAVSRDLGTAAAQLETLTANILTGGAAPDAAPPEPAKLEATHFFLALDLLLVRIEDRSQRVAAQAARLDRLFDLNAKPAAQAS